MPRPRLPPMFLESGLGAGTLDESPSSVRRIDAWLAVASAAV